MQYTLTIFKYLGVEELSVTTTKDREHLTSFPAVVGNPNYDQFLVDAQLTDSEVQALTPDTWYDFPKDAK